MRLHPTTVAAALIVIVWLALTSGDSRVRCFEDEVIMWDGTAHTLCVPLDELKEN